MKAMDTVLKIIDGKFRSEPFHTLGILYGDEVSSQLPGGTCSDKTQSFLHELRLANIDARLWTAFIGDKEIHRLVRLKIDGSTYFADVGNGWPAIFPYPANQPICYEIFGMTFRTEVDTDCLKVYHKSNNHEYLQMRIMFKKRPEREILDEINNRFNHDIIYPFSNRMRFSAVVDDEFLFLRDDKLLIFSESEPTKIIHYRMENIEEILFKYFGYLLNIPSQTRSV